MHPLFETQAHFRDALGSLDFSLDLQNIAREIQLPLYSRHPEFYRLASRGDAMALASLPSLNLSQWLADPGLAQSLASMSRAAFSRSRRTWAECFFFLGLSDPTDPRSLAWRDAQFLDWLASRCPELGASGIPPGFQQSKLGPQISASLAAASSEIARAALASHAAANRAAGLDPLGLLRNAYASCRELNRKFDFARLESAFEAALLDNCAAQSRARKSGPAL